MILIVFLLVVFVAVATALKGKWGFFIAGFFIQWFWIFGAIRLAKPKSWWARRFYDGGKMNRAMARHEGVITVRTPEQTAVQPRA